MAWGDQQDYWWLGPKKGDSGRQLQAMQLGAQIKQQMIQNALKEKDLQLDAQRNFIQTQEYFSKKELQNKQMEGTASLALRMAQFPDMTDPKIPEVIYGELSKSPMLKDVAEQFLDNHRQAVQFKLRQKELEEVRLSREQLAADALAAREAARLDNAGRDAVSLEIRQQQEERLRDDLKLRKERFDFEMGKMSPEARLSFNSKRKTLESEVKALDDSAVLGKVIDPSTGKRSAELYQQKRREIIGRISTLEDGLISKSAAPTSPSGEPLKADMKNPITKEEYDKLPAGASYIAPDGSTRVKK